MRGDTAEPVCYEYTPEFTNLVDAEEFDELLKEAVTVVGVDTDKRAITDLCKWYLLNQHAMTRQ